MRIWRSAAGISVSAAFAWATSGCAGAPTVSDVYLTNPDSCPPGNANICHYAKQSGKGVFYYLPRTELELQLDVRLETVTPGRFGKYIDSCKQTPDDPDCKAEAKFKFKQASADSGRKLCESTKSGSVASTTFYSLGEKTSVSAVAVPDPTHLYFVEVTPSWWQTINASLLFSDSGLPGEMSAGGTNAAGKELVDAAAAIGSAVLLMTKGPQIEATSISELLEGSGIETGNQADRKERRAVVQKLQAIEDRRNSIVLNAPINGNAAPVLAALDAREKELRAVYEGSVKSDALLLIRTLTLRDDAVDPLGPDIRREPDGSINPIRPKIEVPGCAVDGGDPVPAVLPLLLTLVPEPNSSAIALAQDFSKPPVVADQQGFRYRVPVPVKVKLVAPADGKPLVDRDYPVEIAQIGPTLTLPRKAGIWGGTIGANFVGSTGRLKQFRTDSTAGPAGEIVTQVSTEAAKDRRIDALEKEEHELDLKAKIKEHNDALAGKNDEAE